MGAFLSISAWLVAATCFCLGSANAAEGKFTPFVIELSRCHDAMKMTLNMLPLCSYDDWDVPAITKAAQAQAQYKCDIVQAIETTDIKNKPDDRPFKEAKDRRDKLLETALTPKQIQQLLDFKGMTDLITEEVEDSSGAYGRAYWKKADEIVSKSPVRTAQEVSGWSIPLQDLNELLQEIKKNPELASPEIQSAIGLSQEALKSSPHKAAALVRQITETLLKNEADL